MHTQDARVHQLMSVVLEAQMLKIVTEMRAVTGAQKSNFGFEDLQKAMSEFGVQMKRPPFLAEKQPPRKQASSARRSHNSPRGE